MGYKPLKEGDELFRVHPNDMRCIVCGIPILTLRSSSKVVDGKLVLTFHFLCDTHATADSVPIQKSVMDSVLDAEFIG